MAWWRRAGSGAVALLLGAVGSCTDEPLNPHGASEVTDAWTPPDSSTPDVSSASDAAHEKTPAIPDAARDAADGHAGAGGNAGALHDAAPDGSGGASGGAAGSGGSGGAGGSPPADSGYVGPKFTDVTLAAGIDYVQHGPSPPTCPLPNTHCGVVMSGGAAAGDYDGDGDLDLYVTRLDDTDILYRNRGDGTFEDATLESGLTFNLRSNGPGWGDVDNDGDLDLYVTTLLDTRFYLFINDGNGVFTEEGAVRGAAIIGPDVHQGMSVAFGDYDRDGFLDISVGEWRRTESAPGALSNARLLRNRGASAPGHFEDVTQSAGVALDGASASVGGVFVFTPTFTDLDDDGWPDLTMANDFLQSKLFWNNGNGTFTDGTVAAGVGTDESGMGSAIGDFDGDGDLDWFVTAIYPTCGIPCQPGAGNRLYRNDGNRVFGDHTDIALVRRGYWGWGAAFLDFDNDRDLDLVMTNGMADWPDFENDPMRLWRNDGAGQMPEISADCGLSDTGRGKALVVFDYDGDGDQDVFVVNQGGRPVLYRNDGGNTNDWLRVRLESSTLNRHGIGGRVTVVPATGATPMVREIRAGSQYLAQSEMIAHFGLGEQAGPIAEVRVRWPTSGNVQVLTDVAPNQTLVIDEP